MMMAGRELDCARRGHFFRLFRRLGQTLVHERADGGAPLRAAHARPGNRRAGVEDEVFLHPRDDVDRLLNVDPHRFCVKKFLQRFLISLFDHAISFFTLQRLSL